MKTYKQFSEERNEMEKNTSAGWDCTAVNENA